MVWGGLWLSSVGAHQHEPLRVLVSLTTGKGQVFKVSPNSSKIKVYYLELFLILWDLVETGQFQKRTHQTSLPSQQERLTQFLG